MSFGCIAGSARPLSSEQTATPIGTVEHPIVTGDVIHPGVCVDGRTPPACDPGPVVRTFTANTTVDIRLALGGERDWDFDWTPFTVGQQEFPISKDDCKRGGWADFGFPNQGQCIKFVKDAEDKERDEKRRARREA